MTGDQAPHDTLPQDPTLSPDLADTLTLREAAALLARHPQTVRRYIREGRLAATQTQGRYGEEHRIDRSSLEDLARELGVSISDSDSAIRQADSRLYELAEMLGGLLGTQKALLPSEEERQAQAERQQRIEEALAGNVTRIEELARENERLRAELAEAQDQAAAAEEELEAESAKAWWQKLIGR